MKANLLLDIDGVLSPLGSLPDDQYAVYSNDWTTWRIPYDTVYFLHRIKDKVTLVNSSSWAQDAEGLYRHMLLPIPKSVDFSDAVDGAWAKEEGLKDFLTARSNEVNIILDDEFSWEFLTWAEDRKNVFLLKVDGVAGLSQNHVNEIDRLIASV